MKLFDNRTHAGLTLADYLLPYAKQAKTIVLGLVRGGVPVAYEVAQKLSLPFDIFLVKKLYLADYAKFTLGAVAFGDTVVFNDMLIRQLMPVQNKIDHAIACAQRELLRYNNIYRHDRSLPEIKDQTIILIDDSLVTGITMHAAVTALKRFSPAKLIIAAPIATRTAYQMLSTKADEIVCPFTPEPFHEAARWYKDFSVVSDASISQLLK